METTSAAYGARANRPAYSVLDNAKLRSLGLDDLRDWREALADYLDERMRLPVHPKLDNAETVL